MWRRKSILPLVSWWRMFVTWTISSSIRFARDRRLYSDEVFWDSRGAGSGGKIDPGRWDDSWLFYSNTDYTDFTDMTGMCLVDRLWKLMENEAQSCSMVLSALRLFVSFRMWTPTCMNGNKLCIRRYWLLVMVLILISEWKQGIRISWRVTFGEKPKLCTFKDWQQAWLWRS